MRRCSNRPQARGGGLQPEPAREPPRQTRQSCLTLPEMPTTGRSDNGTRAPTSRNAAIWRQAMYRAAHWACTERQPHKGRAAKCLLTDRTTIARNAAIWPLCEFNALLHDAKRLLVVSGNMKANAALSRRGAHGWQERRACSAVGLNA